MKFQKLAVAALFALILGASSYAGAAELASTSFPATARNGQGAVVRVTLTSRGLLDLRVERYPDIREYFPRFGEEELPYTVVRRVHRLSATAFENLLADLRPLANAEIEERFLEVICAQYPTALNWTGELDVARDYRFQTGTFEAEVTRIRTGPWCWTAHVIAPVAAHAQARANTFQAKLEILARQLLNRHLKTRD